MYSSYATRACGWGPYFWSTGGYTVVADGTWKGHLSTNQHTSFPDPLVRPLFAGQEVTSGFTGTFAGDRAEVFGTTGGKPKPRVSRDIEEARGYLTPRGPLPINSSGWLTSLRRAFRTEVENCGTSEMDQNRK